MIFFPSRKKPCLEKKGKEIVVRKKDGKKKLMTTGCHRAESMAEHQCQATRIVSQRENTDNTVGCVASGVQ